MILRKAYKFQLKTDSEIERALLEFSGCCRFVWNKALAAQKERLNKKQSVQRYESIAKELPQWKKECPWLKGVHSQVLQQTLKDQDKALRAAFNKKNPSRFPRFKKKGRHDSFRYPQGFELNGSCIYLPRIGWVRFRKSREIKGIIKNVTVGLDCGRWTIAIQVEEEVAKPVHPSQSAVGMDMGIRKFAALSNGDQIEPIGSFKKWEAKLAREQRKLSKKVKFSHNWKKQKKRLARVHKKIADTRVDFLHKISTIISKNHAMVVVEDLKVVNMSRSARGSLENPGRHVRIKSQLNKSILDQGWSEFFRQLDYKQNWQGGVLVKVDPKYTSQRCSECGHVEALNRSEQDRFNCRRCGFELDADENAARNILAAGHAVIACGEKVQSGLSEKQEPILKAA